MSWWVYLKKGDGEVCEVEKHSEGGTCVLGGTSDAEINITYNYSPFYYKYLDKKEGLRWLNGRKAKDCIKKLENAVAKLGTKRNTKPFWTISPFYIIRGGRVKKSWLHKNWDNPKNEKLRNRLRKEGVLEDGGAYWKPTPGNAGYDLNILLQWARQHPEGIFEVH